MNSHPFVAVAVLVFAFTMACEAREMRSQEAKTKYPHVARVEEYLMTDRNAEIALARSAAPESISHDATVLVLGRHGYEKAVEGKNGFVCVVERGWMSPRRRSGVLEPPNPGSDLLQSSSRAICLADDLQEDRNGFGGENEG